MTGAFPESIVEDAVLRDTLLPKLISGELHAENGVSKNWRTM